MLPTKRNEIYMYKYIYLYEQHSDSMENHNGLGWEAYFIRQ